MKSKKPKPTRSLGRGLSALFEPENSPKDNISSEDISKEGIKGKIYKNTSSSPTTESSNPENKTVEYQLLPLNLIHANPNQPRNHFDNEKLEELATSIKNYGIIEPIIVNPMPTSEHETTYEIIAGERRVRAARLAELVEIPAIIKSQDNENLLEIMLIENLQREDLAPMEEALSYETIIAKKNITQEQLADLLGKSRSYITNMIRLLKAPLSIRQKLADNRLSVSQARTIMNLPEKEMLELAHRAEINGLSVRELEKLVKQNRKTPSGSSKQVKQTTKDPNISEIENMYRDHLKTKVTIHPLKNKRGKIEIEYYDYEELLEILSKMNN